MGEYVIRQLAEFFLYIVDDHRGKLICLIANAEEDVIDSFSVGISWKSIDKLRDRAKRKVFTQVSHP